MPMLGLSLTLAGLANPNNVRGALFWGAIELIP